VTGCDNYGQLFSRAYMCIFYEVSFEEELGILGQDATSVDNNVSEELAASIFRGSVVWDYLVVGVSKDLQNVGKCIPIYTASCFRTL